MKPARHVRMLRAAVILILVTLAGGVVAAPPSAGLSPPHHAQTFWFPAVGAPLRPGQIGWAYLRHRRLAGHRLRRLVAPGRRLRRPWRGRWSAPWQRRHRRPERAAGDHPDPRPPRPSAAAPAAPGGVVGVGDRPGDGCQPNHEPVAARPGRGGRWLRRGRSPRARRGFAVRRLPASGSVRHRDAGALRSVARRRRSRAHGAVQPAPDSAANRRRRRAAGRSGDP